ncbi:MAG TPA: SDR family oxidoreductase [Pyrinomonadaceae bacterium]|jgi:NAD(P)-dependent dehydrogenase (short-subunit alcohol dehydrogenase family)
MATKSNKQGAKKGGSKSSKKGGAAQKSTKSASKKSAGSSASKSAAAKSAGQSAAKGSASKRGASPPRVLEQPESPMPAQHVEKPGLEAELALKPRYEAPHYRGSSKLNNRAALITGGDSGIGRAVAVLFAREGADVAIVYLPREQVDAEETRTAVEREGRRALLIPGDVREPGFCREAVGRTVEEFGKLDILVNNAAFQQHQKTLEEVSDEQFDRTFKTNIYGYFYMAKAALGHMSEGAVIINTGSITGLEGNKELLDYSATKGAIHAFTKSLAQNLVERRIRVNCVAPGPVWTPLNPADKEAKDVAEFGADTPLKRPAQPEEMAPAYVFFASEADSSYITGEVLTLLGGDTTAG